MKMNIARVGAFSALFASFVCAAPKDKVRLLVKPKASMSEAALHAIVASGRGEEQGTIPALDVRIISVAQAAAPRLLAALQRNADVEYAEPDQTAQAFVTANDPYVSNQWHLAKLQAQSAWDITIGSSRLPIAILDTGVLASHPDLRGKVLSGYDFVNNDSDATDDNGHGTAVAGVSAAASNNQVGISGVAWANPILPVKVLGADGSGSHSAIANGITWAADRGAKIINLSLGGTSSSSTLQNAVNYAWNKGAVIIAAAGNNGNTIPCYPAACQNVIAVSATDSKDIRPSWSNYGSYIDIAAPGAGIVTLQGSNSYASWNGTSFASPVASGVVALMRSADSNLSNLSIVNLLLANSDDIGAPGYDIEFGTGRVNALRAVEAARGSAIADTQAPTVSIPSPAAGATVSGIVNIQAQGTDNVGVTRMELYVDGVLRRQAASGSISLAWDTQAFLDGAHRIEARAYDAANNAGSIFTDVMVRNSMVVDTVAPTVTITSPIEGSSLPRTAYIRVAANDNVAVTSVEIYLDGTFLASSSSANPVFRWNTSKVSRGAHTLVAYGYDAAGNIGVSYTVNVRK